MCWDDAYTWWGATQELETALKTLQVWEGPEQLKKIFAELDIDGNGSIEFYEFCTVVCVCVVCVGMSMRVCVCMYVVCLCV
jgi:hypothetical protein